MDTNVGALSKAGEATRTGSHGRAARSGEVLHVSTMPGTAGAKLPAKAESVNVSVIVDSDNQNKAVLTITNREFIQDLWITVEELSAHLDTNFKSLLPGTHTFSVEFDRKFWFFVEIQVFGRKNQNFPSNSTEKAENW